MASQTSSRVAAITGVKREAACLATDTWAFISGANSDVATLQATQAIADGAQALVSFGTCGGLAPDIAAGTLFIPDRVLLPSGDVLEPYSSWRERVIQQTSDADIGGVTEGLMVTSPGIAARPDQKRNLREQTGAVAVDMESGAVLSIALKHNVPALVLRAVADTAHHTLPMWVGDIVSEGGSVDGFKLARHLIRRPQDLLPLIRLAQVSDKAFATLRRTTRVVGGRFCF